MSKEIQTVSSDIMQKPTANELTLADLIKLGEPLLKSWTEAENEKHRRELEYENNRLQIVAKQNRLITFGLFAVLGLVLINAGILFYFGRDSIAMDLIKLIVGIGGAAFGGYGWAITRRKEEEEQL
ncbi:MAG: hypothetical protein MPEBLZ_00024 [Candidatus Methanoperedens nitroreducens]|uniref:DUF2335 domain-containing protein n=1 Tax=Candidatus Methanoperedens nitratireducens TaxID=1392998 RepID=A0A0P8AED9_9EURY|nr:hypothetical protein [Candidatus Methanoperedens sp. BLZ2]KAB2945483.1 MAG: hypothetical protein F9K14_10635 [Candidatus Methanoperedens sp.]KPQ45350.1 MAG: hypothetical protein MPEBLZ_00024 [Candidatus Methanoperedens sp. BLZ1]MBZ0174730.1 hypothetical protein [Candidatus Methanoperedens nitroreducens]MCX9080074.1 hypothetical protein [Candidatus Methanoperedens sp.]